MLKELILKNRSYRRFHEEVTVSMETLRDLVDLARLSPSAGNLQPLRYILSCDGEKNDLIFPNLMWAGYLSDWEGPVRGERPSAYVVVLGETTMAKHFDNDAGIACQSILLGAVEKGLGGCIIGSLYVDELRKALRIDDAYKILLVIALGSPKERIVLDEVHPGEDTKYWRDSERVHHVPKRSLDEIIVE